VKIKTQNRQIYLALEEKKNELETKKGVVDMLKLNYENLLYKQAYLQREIRACKDLATPNLSEIEQELGKKLAAYDFSDRLSEVNENALSQLETERQARMETEGTLVKMKETRDEALKKLDRKRKFLDELPGKIEAISNLAKELEAQFDSNNSST
jgi:chromosome segregation ATPase